MAITEHYGRMINLVLKSQIGLAPLLNETFGEMCFSTERWPIMVRYDNLGVRYVPRDHFAWTQDPRPSDSVWIIPESMP